MTRRIAGRGAIAVLLLLVAYLAAWPVEIDPVAWHAPPSPDRLYPPNDGFAGLERLGEDMADGPEAIAIDAEGRVHTGTRDGRILRLDPATGRFEEVANTGGRPLGLAFDAGGHLYVADAEKGLLVLAHSGRLRSVASAHAGVPFRFTDDVDVAPDGTVYFTDASSRWSIHEQRQDVIEHRGYGRLLAFHPETGQTELLLSGLEFANGVAVAGDGSYVLVNETGAYRITRYWLAGPRRGKAETFLDNLPGLPDNITWSPSRRAFWVALYSPRVPALDRLAGRPWLRKVVMRIPRFLQPQPAPQGFAIAVSEAGQVVASLRDATPHAYAPVTSVRERGDVLWLGSVEARGIARLPAPQSSGARP